MRLSGETGEISECLAFQALDRGLQPSGQEGLCY